jgi:hypothetical protein
MFMGYSASGVHLHFGFLEKHLLGYDKAFICLVGERNLRVHWLADSYGTRGRSDGC